MTILIPAALDELAAMMKETPAFSLLAGGTDYMVADGRRSGGVRPAVIDLSGLAELRGLKLVGGEMVVGAMETMSTLAADDELRRRAACLSEAASKVGSWQIRNRATLGGNLANSSPAADTPPALAALKAEARLLSPRGERRVPVENIPVGPNRAAIEGDEVIVSFHIPLPAGRVTAFSKIGSRSQVSIARLNLAVSVIMDQGQAVEARVFMGTLGRAALRCPEAEAVLRAQGLEAEAPLAAALAEAAAGAIPGRSTLSYKQSAAGALAQDVLALLRERAKADGGLK